MKIALIGYGNMAEVLGSKWVKKHPLYISGRNLEKAQALANKLGNGTECGSEADASSFAEVIVLATQHKAVFEAMDAAGGPDALAGKVLLDINNPVDAADGEFLPKHYDEGSLAEAIAKYAPAAHVVKAFNMCQAQVWQMEPPLFDGRPLVTLYCGDNPEAKQKVAALIEEVGCEPEDLGELKYARLLEAAAAIVIKFLFSGHDVHTVLNLIKPESRAIS